MRASFLVPFSLSSSSAAPLDVALDAASRHVAAPLDAKDEVLLLFDTTAPALRRCIGSCGVPPDVADDLVQEAFVALFQHLRKGGNRDNLRAWVIQVGYRLALKHRRSEGRRGRWQGPWEVDVADVPDPTTGPEAACAAREEQRRLHSVLKALPARDRQCVYLRADGLRYREIAGILGISLGAVSKSLARAVGRLSTVIHESR
jgi:RNA polymerase sigma-70 factor (ECF subfamily)